MNMLLIASLVLRSGRCSLLAATCLVAACGGGDPVSGNVVPDDRVTSVVVSPASAAIAVNSALTLQATARDASGREVVGQAVSWSSSSAAVASVTAAGLVTGVSAGSATISATISGVSGNAMITVLAGQDTVVTAVLVTPPSATVSVGGTVSLGAIAQNAAGQSLSGKSFTWTSAAPTVASVGASGVVTGVSVGGPVSISATLGSKSGSASITVAPSPTSVGTITVNGAQQFQTMTGWEALMEIGQAECDPRAYQTYKNEVLDRAAFELGINRIRVGLRSGFENPTDSWLLFKAGQITFTDWNRTWFRPVNDNSDPFVMNPAGFNWGFLDYTIEELILPLKQRLQSRGDDLWFNLSYTGARQAAIHLFPPDEYAEFVLAAFQHIKQKYGIAPNSLELMNEPNLQPWWGADLAPALLAAKRRLNQAGFFPDFVGPTASSAYGSILIFDQMIQFAGMASTLNEISYHRFGETLPSYLQGLAQRAAQYGMRTAMLEHGGSGYQDLHEDLTVANVSAWQQFGLAFCGNIDDGGVYFLVTGAKVGENNPVVNTGKMAKFLRQYFRYVSLGAVRLGAASTDARFAPVAFRNKNGKYVVVVKAAAGGSFTVGGLPAGNYGIDYTTAQNYMRALPDVAISGSQSISTAVPDSGVLTIYAK